MTLTTTPSFVFSMSDDPANYYDIVIAFFQGGVPKLVKHKDQLQWSGFDGGLKLTAAETQMLDHSGDVVISVSLLPDEDNSFEVARVQKRVYYVYGDKLRVGFEDETTEVLINVNEYSAISPIQVDANVLNALKGSYKPGLGIDITDDVISVQDDIVLDGDGV